MEKAFSIAMALDGLLLALCLEVFRQRLAALMGAHLRPDEYPSWTGRLSALMGGLVVWTAEHRAYQDAWLNRWAWGARLTMLGLPILVVAFVFVVGGR